MKTKIIGSTACHDGKVLCLDWLSSSNSASMGSKIDEKKEYKKDYNSSDSLSKEWRIISGGSDCFLKSTLVKV
jgi:hypothetical protein